MVISIINQKGGVGKTTTTVNLGVALAQAGRRVLLVDLDAQESLLLHAHNITVPNMEVRRETARSLPQALSQALGHTSGHTPEHTPERVHDLVLIDCGPTLGEETAAALKVADVTIAPTPPRFLDLAGLSQLLHTVEAARERGNPALRFKILLTMRARQVAHREFEEQLRAAFGSDVFESVIPRLKVFEDAASARCSTLEFEPHGVGADAFRSLALEVLALAPSSARSSKPAKPPKPSQLSKASGASRDSSTPKASKTPKSVRTSRRSKETL
jgi:chromosome partitioning protein